MGDIRERFAAEFIGTFLLVFLCAGAAITGIVGADGKGLGILGVAMAFGLVLMALAYAIGPTSGAHVNPAVTLAFIVSRRQEVKQGLIYMVAQFAGAIVAGGLLKIMVTAGGIPDQTGGLGTNTWKAPVTTTGAFLTELILTAAFVGVVLLVTDYQAAPGFAGLAVGGALAAVHMFAIPITGTSVNPARSLGPALFMGGDSLSQLWLFFVAPFIGGVIAVGFWALVRPSGGRLGDEGEEAYEREVKPA